ncbi:MAG: substrate-binding domain-containing protein [Armatimonadetes bacterium]|nr:substrate-binding domain-containing protein [Armatimonadota bacterium]
MRVLIVVVLIILVVVGGVLAWRARSSSEQSQTPAQMAETEKLYLAVPMGVFVAMNEVMTQFKETHPQVQFDTMVDTPEMMAQAVEENEQKPDIFISPGGHEVTVLLDKGFIDPDTLVAFGSYEVAILVPKGNPGNIYEPADLLNPEVKLISFSPPDLTAASHAARQALQNMGLWEKLEPKVKVTGCCNESFQWIVDGRAEANVQFLGCPMDTKSVDLSTQKAEIACLFPRDAYYIPRTVAGILKTTEKRELAEEFLAFMTAPEMLEKMATLKLRNDQELPLEPGPWGHPQEAGPVKVAQR